MNITTFTTFSQPATTKLKRYTPRKMMGLLLFTSFLVYMVVPLALHSSMYEQLILYPTPLKLDNEKTAPVLETGIKGETVWISGSDGSRMHGWLFRRPSATKLAIVHHGNAGSIVFRKNIALMLLAADTSVLLYDYRGYGASEGKTSLRNLVQDGFSAYDYAVNTLKYAPTSIIHYGESIGSGVATIVASDKPSGGLILQSPIGSLPLVGKFHYAFLRPYPDFFFPSPRLNNVEQIKRVQAPLIVLHGLADDAVPYQHARMIFANAKVPKQLLLLRTCKHNDLGSDPATYESLWAFVGKLP